MESVNIGRIGHTLPAVGKHSVCSRIRFYPPLCSLERFSTRISMVTGRIPCFGLFLSRVVHMKCLTDGVNRTGGYGGVCCAYKPVNQSNNIDHRFSCHWSVGLIGHTLHTSPGWRTPKLRSNSLVKRRVYRRRRRRIIIEQCLFTAVGMEWDWCGHGRVDDWCVKLEHLKNIQPPTD